MTIFMRCQVSFIASTISSSVAVRMSVRWFDTKCQVRSFSGTFNPSATVCGASSAMMWPARNERAASSAFSGSAAMTSTSGARWASDRHVPEIMPPPPIGATTVSSPCTCSISSSEQVAWPATTRGSL